MNDEQIAWSKYANDFTNMTDTEIENECNSCRDQIDEAEDWLEAVAAWQRAGRPRKTLEQKP
jgi:hypothetical protein